MHVSCCGKWPILILTIACLAPCWLPAETMKPLVAGRRGVVAAGHPLVAEAGLRIMEKGGNAVDAGVATVFAASVVEMNGFGAGAECPILIKLAGNPVVAINGAGTAPELATVDFYKHLRRDDPRVADVASISKGTIPAYGLLSTIVPSAVDALLVALERYGTMSFAEVIQPAIELAEGFPLDAHYARGLERAQPVLEKWPTSKRVYLPNGRAPQAGEIFVQADLARTFRSMAEAERQHASQGRAAALEAVRDYFYRGPIARRISDFCQQAGCLLREGDFASYHSKIETPLTTNYRGVDVYKVSFWSQSPAFLENLNLLEGFDLQAMGHNSADYIHTIVEAMKLGYADRDAYYGDPDFSEIPMQLISKEYAALRRPLIALRRPERRAPGHDVRQCHRQRGEHVLRHAQRRVVSGGDRRGHRHPAQPARPIVRSHAGTSESDCPAQAAAHHADTHPRCQGQRALAGLFNALRRQPRSDAAPGFPERRRIRHEPAGSRGGAALRFESDVQLVRRARR
jgi:gamma-glutamyltranspeptidase